MPTRKQYQRRRNLEEEAAANARFYASDEERIGELVAQLHLGVANLKRRAVALGPDVNAHALAFEQIADHLGRTLKTLEPLIAFVMAKAEQGRPETSDGLHLIERLEQEIVWLAMDRLCFITGTALRDVAAPTQFITDLDARIQRLKATTKELRLLIETRKRLEK